MKTIEHSIRGDIIQNLKEKDVSKDKNKKQAPASNRGPVSIPRAKNKTGQPVSEQDPEQYAVQTLSEKGKQGTATVKKAVKQLTKEKELPALATPDYYRTPAPSLPRTEKTVKSRKTLEQVHHTAVHDMKSLDAGVKDKTAVAKNRKEVPAANPPAQAHIRQRQADLLKERTDKIKTQYQHVMEPTSDISEAGSSLPVNTVSPGEQAKDTAVQKLKVRQDGIQQRKKKTNTTGNQSDGGCGQTGFRENRNPVQRGPSETRRGYDDTAFHDDSVIDRKAQDHRKNPTQQPESDSKKLKTVDRQNGTLKTKEEARIKHHSGDLKGAVGKDIKRTGNAQIQPLKGAGSAKSSGTVNGMGQAGRTGATAAKSASGAATGGVMAAVEMVKKGKDKLQEIAEKNTADTPSDDSSSPKTGCFGVVAGVLFVPCLILFLVIFGRVSSGMGSNRNLSAEVLAYMPLIQETCQQYGIPEYAYIVAAIMMQESGGRAGAVNGDVMQAAESRGWPAGTPIEPALSIEYGVQHFKECLELAGMPPPGDIAGISLSLQGYNCAKRS